MRQTIVQNFEREANILVALEHPSIPSIYDYFTHNERSYLVLEYIQGKDIEDMLNQSKGFFSEEQVIEWAIELCDVLHFLHNHKPEPIIFRDMKPSNVMVNQYGHIVLIDFGIAKNFRGSQKGTMIGTEGYSPPEQYRGEASPQADIYALGATLHHMLTRRDPRLEPPFTFNDRPVRNINPAVSVELETVINTALQYNVLDRFQTAKDMREALIMAGRKTGILTRVPSAATVSKLGEVKPLWTFKCEDEIRGTPTVQNDTVYVGAYDNNLYVIGAQKGEFLWKYPTDGAVVGKPALINGQVIFGSEDCRVYSVEVRLGHLAWTFVTEGPVRSSPFVAQDHIFFGSDDGYLYAVNAQNNRLYWRFASGAPVRSSPVVSGDQVYFGNDAGDFFCLSISGQVKWRTKAKRAIMCTPLVTQNTVFFTSLDSNLYALDAKSGWTLWRYRMGKGSVNTPCLSENYLITGAADGLIYCLDAGSAKEIWRFQAEHQVSGSPIVYKDSVFSGTADGLLYCLEYRTGRLRWKFKTGGPITGTPIEYNDVLYVGSADHTLYAIPV